MSGEARGLGRVLAVLLAAHVARAAACARVVALRGLELAREGVDLVEALAALAPLEVDVGRAVAPGRLRARVADVLALFWDDAALRLAARPTSIFRLRFPPAHDAALPLTSPDLLEVEERPVCVHP